MREKDRNNKSEAPFAQIVVDGDVSIDKLKFLVELGREEECLDYKEKFDFSTTKAKQRVKIDLVCDLVAMNNTEGGYIIVGISEIDNRTFKVIGVDDTNLAIIKQENLQNWVDSYTDTTLKIYTKVHVYDDEHTLILISIPPSLIPAIFNRDGQYSDIRHNRTHTKFRQGELFVRHGAKSERAIYADWVQITEKIREDERRKVSEIEGRNIEIITRLDTIIKLLGGIAPSKQRLNVFAGTEREVEDRIIDLLSLQNPIIFKRSLNREFQDIIKYLSEQQNISSNEKLIENLNRKYLTFLIRLFAVWVALVEYGRTELSINLDEQIYMLYVKSNTLQFNSKVTEITPLWIQSKIIYIAIIIGAYAIYKGHAQNAKLFINHFDLPESEFKDFSWIRSTQIKLVRVNQLKRKTITAVAFDFAKGNPYLVESFGAVEDLLNSICQFDFLYCINELILKRNCYPSFGTLKKWRIEPIVEKMIETYNLGTWIPKLTEQQCVDVIKELDQYAHKEFSFNYGWYQGEWNSNKIRRFLK